MRRPDQERPQLLTFIAAAWLISTLAALGVPQQPASSPPSPVVVTHWANGHMMNPALLPSFAGQFNNSGHTTNSGRRIAIDLATVNSGTATAELISRAGKGVPIDPRLPDPVLVTPAADHWLTQVNLAANRTVVDPTRAEKLATTWIGIVTYREMAECLGWPAKEVGIADIVDLRTDPRGWDRCSRVKGEWGQRPMLAFTDPDSSSTARSMLFSLYSIAAGKSPSQLTMEDVTRPSVVSYLKAFQRAVDQYVPDTLILNSKILLGPRYGHFFFISEDNLVQLYRGQLAVTVGAGTRTEPLSRSMVMIYPKEGSTAHNHSAAPVQADWVTAEQREAAAQWVAFLREEPQQRAFMAEGFRPVTGIPLGEPISSRFGLDPSMPRAISRPDDIDPAVASAIVKSWGDVKKPGVVTFVVDVSTSMQGPKLEQAKEGLMKALSSMDSRNSVGLVTFSDAVNTQVQTAPLAENRFDLTTAISTARASGQTALYDAIKQGILMTDAAPGDDEAIRGVVVVTDGKANRGNTWLSDLIEMISLDEKPVRQFRGFEQDETAQDQDGKAVEKQRIAGTGLALKTRHRIHVYFVGLGGNADMEIGRMLAEATGSAFQGVTEIDLSQVLELFGKYF